MSKPEFTVFVQPQYLEDQSDPAQQRFAFAYTVTIRNSGDIPAQLISRHWVITDENQATQEVRGLGVVGHQPLLPPGQAFEYTSGTVLTTPTGVMQGTYFCTAEDGTQFETPIPAFVLAVPRTLH
jgi:ApaG protein